MFKRLIHFIRWNLDEIQGKKSPETIYDGLAANNTYDELVDYPQRVQCIQKALEYVEGNYHRVLDLACGTGAVLEALPYKDRLDITGVDLSSKMLQKAQKRFSKYPTIIFKRANFMKEKF